MVKKAKDKDKIFIEAGDKKETVEEKDYLLKEGKNIRKEVQDNMDYKFKRKIKKFEKVVI